ncbi:VOC family protein [Brachybacterium sp. DNPG3]
MPAPLPYLLLPGTAREALEAYQRIFGGELTLHTYEQFERTDGPATAIAHGLLEGPVDLCAADAAEGEDALQVEGLLLALLGRRDPAVLRSWFVALSEGGEVLDPLQRRAWGASDGQVRDRFGVRWLVGFEHGVDPDGAARTD